MYVVSEIYIYKTSATYARRRGSGALRKSGVIEKSIVLRLSLAL
jgi:hypothetical protein